MPTILIIEDDAAIRTGVAAALADRGHDVSAVASALEDPRFPPVRLAELAQLDLEISILTPMQPVSGPEAFVVGRHGVVLAAQGRRAVFLPQVAPEQGWDRDTTLTQLSLKAGLPPDAWRSSSARFEVFEAQVFGEPKRKR